MLLNSRTPSTILTLPLVTVVAQLYSQLHLVMMESVPVCLKSLHLYANNKLISVCLLLLQMYLEMGYVQMAF